MKRRSAGAAAHGWRTAGEAAAQFRSDQGAENGAASFAGPVSAGELVVVGYVVMRGGSFASQVTLRGAKIGRSLEMDTSSFSKALVADDLEVSGSLFMRDHAFFADDDRLSSAKVGGDLDMSTASFSKALDASGLVAAGGLFMRDHASFAGDVRLSSAEVGAGGLSMRDASFAGEVDLIGTKVVGNLEMDSASFSKALTADRLDVHGSLFMRDHASFADDVRLSSAKVGGDLDMGTASFSKALDASGLVAAGGLFMRDHASFAGEVSLVNAKVGWLDLRSATASSINLSDLSGATGSELQLQELRWRCRNTRSAPEDSRQATKSASEGPSQWPLGDPSWRHVRCDGTEASVPSLILRNTHIDAFLDGPNSWPPVIDLEGLRYGRLGGLQATERNDMRMRTPEEWIDWLVPQRAIV